jgi:hypothetical protein
MTRPNGVSRGVRRPRQLASGALALVVSTRDTVEVEYLLDLDLELLVGARADALRGRWSRRAYEGR